MSDLPDLYFRIRENGAAVFRLDTETRDRRIEMQQVAVININRAEFKAQGDTVLTAAEEEAISTWITERLAVLAARSLDDIHRAIDHLNLTAQWAQAKATDAQLDVVTDDLLIAMHDLRTVLVRKKADRISKS